MKNILLAFLLGMSALSVQSAFAASQDECAIWLCLPGGFPSGCGGAKSAMKDRLEHFKPPLPPFSDCIKKGGSGGSGPYPTSNYVVAAKMRDGSLVKGTECRVWYNYNGENRSPRGCVGTVKYVDVFDGNGATLGSRYYIQGRA